MKHYITFSFIILLLLPCFAWADTLPMTELTQRAVEDIRFEGNLAVPSSTIFSLVTLNVIRNTKTTPSDVRRDIEAIYLLGYFKEVNVKLTAGPTGMIVTYLLNENPTINEVAIAGMKAFSRSELSRLIGSVSGAVLSYKQIDRDIKVIEDFYKDHGYSICKVVEVKYNPADGSLLFRLSEGQIHEVLFTGNKNIDSNLVYREMEQQNGSVFNANTLRKDRERIIRLGYFAMVSSPRLVPASDGSVDVWFDLTERKINALGLSLEEGNAGIIAIPNAAANIQVNNLLGTGETFTGKVQYGADNVYSLRFFEPWLGSQHVSLGLDSWLQINKADFESKGWDVELGKPYDDYFKTFLTYKSESLKLISYNPAKLYDKRSLGLGMSYDTRNDFRKPKSGMLFFSTYAKGGALGPINIGGVDFSKFTAEYSFFNSFYNNKNTLAFHLAAGVYKTEYAYDRDAAKFIVGGTYSVRGYYDILDKQEGLYKLVGNLEYRMDINELFSWALFYDLGEAYDFQLDTSRLLTGYGVGLRILTPLGPLRFDLGSSAVRPLVFHFGLGEMF